MSDIGDLAEQAGALTNEVEKLAIAVDQLGSRTDRTERITMIVVLGLVLDLVMSGVVAFALYNSFQTSQRENETRQEALCPFFDLIVGSYDPESRPPGPARDKYEASFVEMRHARDTLDCNGPLVPRSGG